MRQVERERGAVENHGLRSRDAAIVNAAAFIHRYLDTATSAGHHCTCQRCFVDRLFFLSPSAASCSALAVDSTSDIRLVALTRIPIS